MYVFVNGSLLGRRQYGVGIGTRENNIAHPHLDHLGKIDLFGLPTDDIRRFQYRLLPVPYLLNYCGFHVESQNDSLGNEVYSLPRLKTGRR